MTDAKGRRLLNIVQAGARAGVSRRTLYNWITAGKIEYVYTAGGQLRIYEDSLWVLPSRRRSALSRICLSPTLH